MNWMQRTHENRLKKNSMRMTCEDSKGKQQKQIKKSR